MYLTKRHNIYYIFYKVNWKKTCKSTKATTKKEALEFLTTFKKEQKKKQLNPSLNLDEFYKLYIGKAEVFLVRSSWSLARRTFNQFLKVVGHTTKLNELTHNQCKSYVFEKFKTSKKTFFSA
ncbi:MAG: hypothetical protein FD143_2743 [Ignavibacteria bacterium]|nr:MAG: hypothetical protein FD143_2743 [Ignavibacteria bacterium]